jgi:hypothetical protein
MILMTFVGTFVRIHLSYFLFSFIDLNNLVSLHRIYHLELMPMYQWVLHIHLKATLTH